jgi:TatD DNase family protein
MDPERERKGQTRMPEKELVDLPDLGAEVADTHAHLDMLDDPAEALERAALAGVTFVMTVVDVTEEPERTLDGLGDWLARAADRLADRDDPREPPEVRIVIGCHPHNAEHFDEQAEERLRELVRDPRVAAIGETGLDFHYDHSPRDDQRRAFRIQLDIAREHGLPVVVHLRDAHEEGIGVLADTGLPSAGCVIHCFTGDAALASRFVELGCYVSFAGPTTFKKAEMIREAAAALPIERVLVETDCPFLAPVPYRGRINEPAWVTLTAAVLAEAKDVSPSEFATATTATARTLFGARPDS